MFHAKGVVGVAENQSRGTEDLGGRVSEAFRTDACHRLVTPQIPAVLLMTPMNVAVILGISVRADDVKIRAGDESAGRIEHRHLGFRAFARQSVQQSQSCFPPGFTLAVDESQRRT